MIVSREMKKNKRNVPTLVVVHSKEGAGAQDKLVGLWAKEWFEIHAQGQVWPITHIGWLARDEPKIERTIDAHSQRSH